MSDFFIVLNFFYFTASIKKIHSRKDPCVDYWLTLTALPTWGSRWFVSGMAELLSGRRGYVTGAADNTWVQSWGLREWPGSPRETARSLQPTASALGGPRGSIYRWGLWRQVCPARSFTEDTFLYSSYGMRALTFEMWLTPTRETAEHSHCLQQIQVSTMTEMTSVKWQM